MLSKNHGLTKTKVKSTICADIIWKYLSCVVKSKILWSLSTIIFLFFFYFLMWFGYPFESFDHQNYIGFLENPFTFFFEPLYTLIAFCIVDFVDPEQRFFVIFLFFTSIPTILVIFLKRYHEDSASPQFIYFWILFKSSVVGFISQRFWFAELWMTYFILRYWGNIWIASTGILFSSGIHFGVAGTLPVLYFFINGVSKKFILAIFLITIFVLYIKTTGYVFFGYDYSRYVGMGEERGLSFFSIASSVFLGVIGGALLPGKLAKKLIYAVIACLTFKVLFYDLDVYSRIYQAQIDLILIFFTMSVRRINQSLFLPLYCMLFAIGQIFVASSSDMIIGSLMAATINSFYNF